MRTVKFLSPISTLVSWMEKVVNYEEYCLVLLSLNYEEPVDGAAEFTGTPLPVSEVPLDISARTHNETCGVVVFSVLLGGASVD